MKSKFTGIALFVITLTTIAVYPALNASNRTPDPGIVHKVQSSPIVDVVFVLDTTGSMSGLIQTAKEKIWSIATTMTSAQQTPDIRIGLVAFRDRGDQYVTQIVDLSDDLDTVYSSLMDFQAEGGGDGPESVNKALYDAVHGVSWSQDPRAYQVIFLLGDAPPHMDYQGEMQYPEILAAAAQKGIVVNTIQCGDIRQTEKPWQQIAALGSGRFFQVEQAGGALAIATPFDKKIARLSEKLDDTRLYYGSKEEKAKMQSKVAATEKLNSDASIETRARRGVFNSSPSGKKNRLGENELVDAVTNDGLILDTIEQEALPTTIQAMKPTQRLSAIKKIADQRKNLQQEIQELAQQRSSYISKKVEEAADDDSSLDRQLYETVRAQAAAVGLDYRDGPDY